MPLPVYFCGTFLTNPAPTGKVNSICKKVEKLTTELETLKSKDKKFKKSHYVKFCGNETGVLNYSACFGVLGIGNNTNKTKNPNYLLRCKEVCDNYLIPRLKEDKNKLDAAIAAGSQPVSGEMGANFVRNDPRAVAFFYDLAKRRNTDNSKNMRLARENQSCVSSILEKVKEYREALNGLVYEGES